MSPGLLDEATTVMSWFSFGPALMPASWTVTGPASLLVVWFGMALSVGGSFTGLTTSRNVSLVVFVPSLTLMVMVAEPERSAEERGSGRARRARSRDSRAARSEPDEYDEPEDDYEEEELDEAPPDRAGELEQDEAEEPVPRRRRPARSPVVRARR